MRKAYLSQLIWYLAVLAIFILISISIPEVYFCQKCAVATVGALISILSSKIANQMDEREDSSDNFTISSSSNNQIKHIKINRSKVIDSFKINKISQRKSNLLNPFFYLTLGIIAWIILYIISSK